MDGETTFQGKQRRHRAFLSVSCSGPAAGELRSSPCGPRRSRGGADLRFTTADADFLAEMLKVQENGTFAERHFRLVNPSRQEFQEAVSEAGQWLSGFLRSPEWDGGNIGLAYAGHGIEDSGAWNFHDAVMHPEEMATLLASSLPSNHRRLRVDILLDSCFSTAFLAGFLSTCWSAHDERLFPCTLMAAALHTECAWELEELGHGIFTYALKAGCDLQKHLPSTTEVIVDRVIDADMVKVRYPIKDPSLVKLALNTLDAGGVTRISEGDQHATAYENGHLEVIGAGYLDLEPPLSSITKVELLDTISSAAVTTGQVPLH